MAKRKKIQKVARGFIHINGLTDYEARFDVVAVDYVTGHNGEPEIEQGIAIDGRANFVPSDERGIAFTRTPEQVLQIVYLTPEAFGRATWPKVSGMRIALYAT